MNVLKYNFLTLSILFMIPGSAIYFHRRDLRKVILRMSLLAIPFAFTEQLFYPDYWHPNFLFNFGDKIGFGIEDFIFVIGLASFTSTVYSFVFQKKYIRNSNSSPANMIYRLIIISIAVVAIIISFIIADIPIIYAAAFSMIVISAVIILKRPDLMIPGVLGGVLSAAVYFILCLIYGFIYPEIFMEIWNTGVLLNRFIMGVPVEELIYGFAAGFSATIIYPYLFNYKFRS